MDTSEHPWMEHDKTGHRAQLPDLPFWRANGWFPVDGPHPEPDFTRDQDPEAPPGEGPSASQPKPVKTAKAAAKTEEN